MQPDFTFTEVKNAFQAIAGLESLSSADEFFLTSSLNRAVQRAYDESDSWPRYLVAGEERLLIDDQIVPYASGCNCPDLLAACNAEAIVLVEIVEQLCNERPPSGSWSANREVQGNFGGGSCDQYIYYGQQYNTASLAKSPTWLGNALGNGYALINTTSTITSDRQVNKFTGIAEAPNPVNVDGTFPCMPFFGSIQLKKYNPNTGLYGSSQAGVSSGAAGIGEYGVFHKTQYNWADGSTVNPYKIGTFTKAAAADEFEFDDPCAVIVV